MLGCLVMDDELDNFIRERKARVAEDKANLDQDPPYMEIQTKPYRTYVSTVKENIPPNKAQGKEDSCNVGLPLGVEYEKKKQRLQHELRMDYRRYMAQKTGFDPAELGPLIHLNNRRSVKQHLSESQAAYIPKQRPPSRRDAATLTEDSRDLYRTLREAKTCSPEDEEDQLLLSSRHHDRLGRPGDQESEEDEELELMDRRTHRRIGTERRTYKTDGREKRDTTRGAAREGRRNGALTKNDDVEFATGLIIGTTNTEEALKRRKERYRQELQEQIAEQHRNKKRERDLELKVAATGANDPEKPPDRIRQFGLRRRKDPQVLEPTATTESESPPRAVPIIEKNGVREKVTPPPPPEHPRVAFQSPLLDYSAALGLGGGGVFPTHQPIAPSFPRAMDTPRLPLFHPHPPSTHSEAYRSPYGEPPHHYYSRNHLDPHTPYYGHLSVPGVGLPMSYWNSPPGGGLSSQFGNHSPHSQHSGSSYPEPPIQSSNETATAEPRPGLFPPERSRSAKERILSYREALKQQEASRRESSELYNKIQEQQERRRLEREEKERYEAQLEADTKNHQPWGRGGGGAPLRDSTGNLIADLNRMHKLNEEAYSNPERWQRRATAAMTAQRPEQPDPNERVSGTVAECSVHDSIDRLSGFTHVQTPQFARGNVFSSQPTQQQVQEQDKYKAYLKQQIEEKLRKKAEEREQTRLEEEKAEKRFAEQRARIQKEYEEEQEKKKRKELEQKAKNEELIHLAEQRKIEAERKKKEADEKENAVLRKQYEKERQARLEEAHRQPSPPIPTLLKKPGIPRYTPRPPTVESQHSTAPLSERSLSGLQSPPVPACRNQLRAAGDHRDVFSELSALRRQLRSEQKRLEGRLQLGDWEDLESPLSDRHRERPQVDVFDMARLRLQAPVRRPNSRTTEPRNLLQIHDSLQLKYNDLDYRAGSSEVPKLDEEGVSTWRRQDYRDLYQPMTSQRSTVQDDYFDLSPPQQSDYLRSLMRGSARGSLLESESAFIDPLGDALPIPHTPDLEKKPQLSARERRRLAKQRPQDQPTGQLDDGLPQAAINLQEDDDRAEERSTRARTGHLLALNRGGNTGSVDVSDDDSSPPQFSLHSPNQRSSMETVATDQWMRPGTSDTLKCLDRPTRRGRLMT